MRCGFVRQANGSPIAFAISSGVKIKDRAGGLHISRLTNVPLCAHGKLSLTITVEIAGCDADVIALSEMTADLVLCPSRIFLPYHFVFVAQDDVGFFVAIHIR